MGKTQPNEDLWAFKTSAETDAARAAYDSIKAPTAVDPAYWEAVQRAQGAYTGREKFSFDLNGDALYQQYKDRFIQQGKMAMQDTMGQAAAMTGGYGNSYASTAGNQAYQAHLEGLNDVVPELQQMAYDRYKQEGQELLTAYQMALGEYEAKYGEYSDQVAQYNADRSHALDVYTGLYGRDYEVHRDGITDEQWQAIYDKTYGSGTSDDTSDTGGADDTSDTGNTGNTTPNAPRYNPKNNPHISSNGFSGSSYSEACNYVLEKGVPEVNAAGIMTQSEWSRRRSSYQSSGQGSAEVTQYSSYKEYLAAITKYLIETYGKK